MLKNYVTITLRLMRRKPIFTVLNVGGLVLGFTVSLLITLFVVEELTFDRFHPNYQNTYKLGVHVQFENGKEQTFLSSPRNAAPHFRDSIAGVARVTQTLAIATKITNADQTEALQQGVLCVDSAFFTFFRFPLVASGKDAAPADPLALLADSTKVMLSSPAAQQLFGGAQQAMGQTVILFDSLTFTVGGVLAPIPSNSSLRMGAVLPMAVGNRIIPPSDMDWVFFRFGTYIQLTHPRYLPAVQQAADSLIYYKEPVRVTSFQLNPQFEYTALKDVHFNSRIPGAANTNQYTRQVVYAFALIALFVLAIAAANYMNLATARSTERAMEIGVRKLIGVHRRQLIRQLLAESLVQTLLAYLLALVLVALLLPFFNTLAGKQFTLPGQWPMLLLFLAPTVLVGLLAGSYPALVISAYPIVSVLKGAFKAGPKGARLRKTLVVVQFSLSIGLLVAVLVAGQQVRFLLAKDLGFNVSGLWSLDVQGVPNHVAGQPGFWQDLAQALEAPQLAYCITPPAGQLALTGFNFTDPQGAVDALTMRYNFVDSSFFNVLEVPFIAGRNFLPTDSPNTVVVNRTAAEAMGYTNPADVVGTTISFFDTTHIVGVIEDFHQYATNQLIMPVAFINGYAPYATVFRTAPEKTREDFTEAEAVWRQYMGTAPFVLQHLASRYQLGYNNNRQAYAVLGILTGVANTIAILGLLGLASYSINQRRREIAIRRVAGASVRGMIFQLTREFSLLIGIAFGLTLPVCWWLLGLWLKGFPYGITLTVWPFLQGGGLAIALVWGVTAVLALRAARTNTVNALRAG